MNMTLQPHDYGSIYQIPIQCMGDKLITLNEYQNQVLLIVNVASHCAFTKQYADLEAMYQNYRSRGFCILAFPCNQFLKQESGSDKEILDFVKNKFHIGFPLFSKIAVKGKEQAPLYQYLETHLKNKPLKFIPWNFTKVLVNASGEVIKQYSPLVSNKKIRHVIENLLP